jgi:predicted acylesterase/phospholipase RssA
MVDLVVELIGALASSSAEVLRRPLGYERAAARHSPGMTRQGSPVAFVLSGGAALGAIQVGMLRALYERGIEPD